jgi:multidrug resistance efflux pump
MRWIAFCFLAVAALGRPAAAEGQAIATEVVVVLADQADLAPLEAGSIREMKVHDGDQVTENQPLVQLDDSKAQSELDVAQAKHQSAKTKFAAAQINVEYAVAANKVAIQDYDRSVQANQAVPGAIPQVTMNEKYLKREETRLSIMKANSDKDVAEQEANVAAAEVAAAKVMVQRHKIVSPIAGEVGDIHKHKGEAVQPTEAVLRVARYDTLWVQGKVAAADYARAQLAGQRVTVNVAITKNGGMEKFAGEVIYVNPVTDMSGKYQVRAKVENRKVGGSWLLSPGMRPTMEIEVRPLP